MIKKPKGIIALDIDGTVIFGKGHLPKETAEYLRSLASEGWALLFVTGRSFVSAERLFSNFGMPYYLCTNNGAAILSMPDEALLYRRYLEVADYHKIVPVCEEAGTDPVIYTGLEGHDTSYYRRDRIPADIMAYLDTRIQAYNETWIDFTDISEVPFTTFPSLKLFTKGEIGFLLAQTVEEMGYHAPLNRDANEETHWVIQITHPEINKGVAVRALQARLAPYAPIIAAGNDRNDIPMFAASDHAVVMEDAPRDVLEFADSVAASARHQGVIAGLQNAIQNI